MLFLNIYQAEKIWLHKQKIIRFLELFSASDNERLKIGLFATPLEFYQKDTKFTKPEVLDECVAYTAKALEIFAYTKNMGEAKNPPYDKSTACRIGAENMWDINHYINSENPNIDLLRDINDGEAKSTIVIILYRFLKSIEGVLNYMNQKKIMQQFVDQKAWNRNLKKAVEVCISAIFGEHTYEPLNIFLTDTNFYTSKDERAKKKYNDIMKDNPPDQVVTHIILKTKVSNINITIPNREVTVNSEIIPSFKKPIETPEFQRQNNLDFILGPSSSFLVVQTTILKNSPLFGFPTVSRSFKKIKSRSRTRNKSRSRTKRKKSPSTSRKPSNLKRKKK